MSSVGAAIAAAVSRPRQLVIDTVLTGQALPSAFCLFTVQVILILALSKLVGVVLKPVSERGVNSQLRRTAACSTMAASADRDVQRPVGALQSRPFSSLASPSRLSPRAACAPPSCANPLWWRR